MDRISAYEFLAPRQIVFGRGSRRELGRHARQLGRRALMVHGGAWFARSGLYEVLARNLRASGIEVIDAAESQGEPTVEQVDAAAEGLRAIGPRPGDFILAVGGGSTLDLGKALAALAHSGPGLSVRDFLEGVGKGVSPAVPPLSIVAMPTTAGTGAEATKNAVIIVDDPPCKKSLRWDALLPQLAIVDPELTHSCPPEVTAHSGMDAITQLIESYISRRARPIPRALARHALPLALRSLPRAYTHPEDPSAREDMSHAALLSGMALANSGLGMAHGVAAALGVVRGVPHGLACAIMLPAALNLNQSVALGPLAELAEASLERKFSSQAAAAAALATHIAKLTTALGIPARLSDVGVVSSDIPTLVEQSRGNSMAGNPCDIDDVQLHDILAARL